MQPGSKSTSPKAIPFEVVNELVAKSHGYLYEILKCLDQLIEEEKIHPKVAVLKRMKDLLLMQSANFRLLTQHICPDSVDGLKKEPPPIMPDVGRGLEPMLNGHSTKDNHLVIGDEIEEDAPGAISDCAESMELFQDMPMETSTEAVGETKKKKPRISKKKLKKRVHETEVVRISGNEVEALLLKDVKTEVEPSNELPLGASPAGSLGATGRATRRRKTKYSQEFLREALQDSDVVDGEATTSAGFSLYFDEEDGGDVAEALMKKESTEEASDESEFCHLTFDGPNSEVEKKMTNETEVSQEMSTTKHQRTKHQRTKDTITIKKKCLKPSCGKRQKGNIGGKPDALTSEISSSCLKLDASSDINGATNREEAIIGGERETRKHGLESNSDVPRPDSLTRSRKRGKVQFKNMGVVGIDDCKDMEIGKCRLCQAPLTLQDSADHTKLHHADMTSELFRCPICGKKTPSLAYHIRLLHHPNRFECDLCHKPFLWERSMLKHRKIVHFPDDQDFLCDGDQGCGKRFFSEWDRNDHLKREHKANKKRIICDLCGMSYKCNEKLLCHLANIHRVIEKTIVCPKCDKKFASKRHLMDHMVVHNPKPDFVCGICSKTFSRERNLNQHSISHRPPQHECKICGKKFLYRAAGLWTHLKQVHQVDKEGLPMVPQ